MSEAIPCQTGRWTWNDGTNTLELMSHGQIVDRQDKKKKDKRELKYDNRSAGKRHGAGRRSPMRQGIKQTVEHANVTLQDVKSVARSMMLEVVDMSEPFASIFNTPQLDDFLMYLLNYFHWVFEKRTKENITNPVHIEPSLAEKQLYEELCIKHNIAQKQLGRTYGTLILGIGICDYHHTSCGRNFHSNDALDRDMYESMFTFCTFFVWIAFRRRDHDAVKTEINRMLRTEHFSPVSLARQAEAAAAADENENANDGRGRRMTVAEQRRMRKLNRVPLVTAMNERSPTVISLMPMPKQEASWLFQRHDLHSPKSKERQPTVQEQIDNDFKHLDLDTSHLQLGIIGESLNLFDPVTLAPIDLESDEKEKGRPIQTESQPPTVITVAEAPPVSPNESEAALTTEDAA